MRGPLIVAVLLAVLLPACTITQTVEPVPAGAETEICIVRNDDVRPGFLAAYENALRARGFEVRVVDAASERDACELTTTYTANWSWDLALYMAYANMRVFRNGTWVGEATYDARGGSATTSKFIDAETKVAELVSALFPSRAPAPSPDA